MLQYIFIDIDIDGDIVFTEVETMIDSDWCTMQPVSEVFFAIKLNIFLDTLILKIFF